MSDINITDSRIYAMYISVTERKKITLLQIVAIQAYL